MAFPKMMRLRQHFHAPRVSNIPQSVEQQLGMLNLKEQVLPGQSVAISVGSRGINNIDVIIKATCDLLKKIEAKPFLVPAMGSHGGGTVEGQVKILADYKITEESMGVPIKATMETVIVGETPHGVPVHFDRYAYEADHVIVCNRVKPHTGFVGEVESGLHKMMLIGLGKHNGALIYHRAVTDYPFQEIAESVSQVVIERCKVIAGLAIVENAYDETGLIAAVKPADFLPQEKKLLKQAESWMPSLPFPEVELLIVDEIGKDISGTGIDTTIVGRKYNDRAATEKDKANCRRIFIRGLTERTHGNASGIGIAEITNKRTVDAIDYNKMRINCLTAGHISGAAIPMWFETDSEAINGALHCNGMKGPEEGRVVQIANTLNLSEVLVSESYLSEVETRDDLEIISPLEEMEFDSDGNLIPVYS